MSWNGSAICSFTEAHRTSSALTTGRSQGIEFTPEGDKLFVGSPIAGRIEVFDVAGDYELSKNPKFLNVGFGHNSLTIGPRYKPKK